MDKITVEILSCHYCGSLTVEIGGRAECPKECPGSFDVVGKIRVPREDLEIALGIKEGD